MGETVKRISPEAVPSLYAKHGIKPMKLVYLEVLSDGPCGCILGLLAAEAIGRSEAVRRLEAATTQAPPMSVAVAGMSGYSPDYLRGLERGFVFPESPHHARNEERMGWEDGRAAALAIAALGRPAEDHR